MRKIWLFLFIPLIFVFVNYSQTVDAEVGALSNVLPDTIALNGVTFDPLINPPASDGSRAVSAENKRLHLIQLNDNLTDAVYDTLNPNLQFIQYVPNRAFIVYASDDDLNTASRSNDVRWAGDYPQSLRVSDDEQVSASFTEMTTHLAQLIDDGAMEQLVAKIEAAGGQVVTRDLASVVAEGVSAEYWRVELPSDQTDILFSAPTLIFSSPWEQPRPLDEGSNLVAAGQIAGNAPTGNYQAWLGSHGFDGSGVKVAIVDDGVDWDHPDLNVTSGTLYGGNNERGEPGSNPPINSGHGTHVAGSVAGDGGTGTADANGFIYGQGTAPGATLHAQDFLNYNAFSDSFNDSGNTTANPGLFSVTSGAGWANIMTTFVITPSTAGTWFQNYSTQGASRLETSSINMTGYPTTVPLRLTVRMMYRFDAGDCVDFKIRSNGVYTSLGNQICGGARVPYATFNYVIPNNLRATDFRIAVDTTADSLTGTGTNDFLFIDSITINYVNRVGVSGPQLIQDSLNAGAALSNNSWGNHNQAQTDDYTLDAIKTNGSLDDPFLTVFSAGNAGDDCPAAQQPCIDSVGNNAKNAIAVGAGQVRNAIGAAPAFLNPNDIASFSSRGLTTTLPANQFFLKPDVVAPGQWILSTEQTDSVLRTSCGGSPANSTIHSQCQGTSMSSPHVAGIAAQFTQMWREHTGQPGNPDPALVKAAIINTTDDMGGGDDGYGNPIGNRPNAHQGWGRVNTDRLLNPQVPVQWYENPTRLNDPGDTWTRTVSVYNSDEPMRISLVWLDPAGTPGNAPLVNDLDLKVTRPDGVEYAGNNFASSGWSQSGGGNDRFNPVENVWIVVPQAGRYKIEVSAFALNGNGYIGHSDPTDSRFSLVCYNCYEDRLYVNDSVDTGLAGYWKFDEGSGTTVYDSSGRDNDLTLAGGGSYSSDVACPACFTNYHSYHWSSGNGGFARNETHNGTVDDAFSIHMQVKRDSVTQGQSKLFEYGGIALDWTGTGSFSEIRATVTDSTNSTIFTKFTTNTAVDGMWIHVTATWSRDGFLRLYLDGAQIVSVPAGSAGLSIADNTKVVFGSNLVGRVDDVRFYEKELSLAQIELLVAGRECSTSGASWPDAYQFLQCALDVVTFPGNTFDEIYVAEGIYKPGTNRDARFTLNQSGLRLLGGFDGTLGDRFYPLAFPTILSGDIDHNDSATTPSGHNSIKVVKVEQSAQLWGFTVEGGLANSPSNGKINGAGIVDVSGGETVYNFMTLRNNHAVGSGGAMWLSGGEAAIANSLFVGNKAGLGGNGSGGAIAAFSQNLEILSSVFSGNSGGLAGALLLQNNNGEQATIEHRIYDSSFANNSATDAAGSGAMVGFFSNLEISNSIIWGSTPSANGQINSSTATLTSSIYEGGWSGSGSDNLSSDPLFADADGRDNIAGTLDDNLRLATGSPAIDSGDSCDIKYYRSSDFVNGDGINGDECDRGAYEYGSMLVVDDDNNSPDTRADIVDALLEADMLFEWWDTDGGSGSEPNADELAAHNQVLWFTGGHSTTTDVVGPTPAMEADLQPWLDSGRRCFMLDSFEYTYSRGNSPFATNYLGLGSFVQDEDYTALTGADLFVGLDYGLHRSRYSDQVFGWSDVLTPAASAKTLFDSPIGSVAISKQTPDYRTAFLGFSLSSVNASRSYATDSRADILEAFFDDCEANLVPTAITLQTSSVSNVQAEPIWLLALFMLAAGISLATLTRRIIQPKIDPTATH